MKYAGLQWRRLSPIDPYSRDEVVGLDGIEIVWCSNRLEFNLCYGEKAFLIGSRLHWGGTGEAGFITALLDCLFREG